MVGFFLFSRLGILILGPQPADEASFLFGGGLVVESDEAGEELLLEGFGFGSAAGDEIGEGHRRGGEIGPAVGGKDGGVDLVVELLQQGDEAGVVDRLLLRGEGFAAAPRSSMVLPREGILMVVAFGGEIAGVE